MKLASRCYECLSGLVHQAADLATDDTSLKQRAIREGMKILDRQFSYDELSIVIAAQIHKRIREITHNPDPYRAMKEKEMLLAKELCCELLLRIGQASLLDESGPKWTGERNNPCKDELRDCLRLAAAGNAIDFFREHWSIKEDIKQSVRFTVDDSEQFEVKLRGASKILYLADNAGEVYFDLPLVKIMRRFARVVYVVKPSPVQNDLTLKDVRMSGLHRQFGKVISTGVASPGIIFSLASDRFKREFQSADLIFAKGMGHYEALSELPPQGKVFYCLMAKCQPVANSLGVPVNSYVAMLR